MKSGAFTYVDISKDKMMSLADGRVIFVNPDHPPIVVNPDGSMSFLEFPTEVPQ